MDSSFSHVFPFHGSVSGVGLPIQVVRVCNGPWCLGVEYQLRAEDTLLHRDALKKNPTAWLGLRTKSSSSRSRKLLRGVWDCAHHTYYTWIDQTAETHDLDKLMPLRVTGNVLKHGP